MYLAASPAPPIDVWIVEDNDQYRQGLVFLVNNVSGLRCVGDFASCEDVLARMDRDLTWETPDIVLMDIELRNDRNPSAISGIDGIALLKGRLPSIAIVMLTFAGTDETIYRALGAGASGYVLKGAGLEEIVGSIREAHRGGMLMPPGVANKVLGFFGAAMPQDFGLTKREIEILEFMAAGLTKEQIARRLNLSVHTVGNHTRSIYQRLHVHSVGEAVAKAIRTKTIQ